MKHITTPFNSDQIASLNYGEHVLISGFLYTARDAAHKRLFEALEKLEPLPIDMKNSIIYYAGPTPAKPGQVIGSCGPTTSGRMDAYTPKLLDAGLKGMIGKGERSRAVKESIVKNGCVYFAAIGGAGAIISKSVEESYVVAYEDLGTEAIRCIKVKDFPAIVVIDSKGNDLYERSN